MWKGQRPIVLVVDDDPNIRNALDRGLERAGFDVRLAEDGDAAMSLIGEAMPNVILLDVHMPGSVDGYELCEIVRGDPQFGDTPVVFISGADVESEKEQAFGVGATAYLQKPFEIADLLEVLKEHLPEEEEEPAAAAGEEWTRWVRAETFSEFKVFLVRERRSSVDRAQEIQRCSPDNLYDLTRLLNLPEDEIARYVAKFLDVPFVQRVHHDDVMEDILSDAFCEKNLVIPVRGVAHESGLALANPFRWELWEALTRTVGRDGLPEVSITSPDTVRALYEDAGENVMQVPSQSELTELEDEDAVDDDGHPILQLADELLRAAVSERASDIHVEPKDRNTLIRFRIDGDMQDIRTLPGPQAARLISRFKALAQLDIAEKRRPQDGSVEVHMGDVRLKLRLATSSTSDGETLIIRLLEPTKSAEPLEGLGMMPEQADQTRTMVNRHQGMVIIVGPTGSGKSTTIFSMLSSIDGRTRSIMSVEDPVEYRIPFANQQQVNERAGVTFESLLKSAMRQDPDVLFLGEIRDQFSAKASLDFASSGHLTVSTLHAANAHTAIFRLERLGLERAGMADSLLGIVAQRLLKKLCPHCREVGPIDAEEIEILSGFTDDVPEKVGRPKGCPACRETGYHGREAVNEILRFDATLAEMIRGGASVNQLRAYSIERGDFMMFDHAVEKVRDMVCSPRDAFELVLLEEMRFRQATHARMALGLEAEGLAATESSAPEADEAPAPAPEEVPTEPAPTPAPAAPPAASNGAVGGNGVTPAGEPGASRVLVVEDDMVTSTQVHGILKGAGYEVTVAADGVEALLALGQGHFHAVVSDINMPNLDGLKLMEMLTLKEVQVPVLFMTADASEDLEEQVLDAGAEDFIRKPLKAEVLVRRVKNAVRRSGGVAA